MQCLFFCHYKGSHTSGLCYYVQPIFHLDFFHPDNQNEKKNNILTLKRISHLHCIKIYSFVNSYMQYSTLSYILLQYCTYHGYSNLYCIKLSEFPCVSYKVSFIFVQHCIILNIV